MAKVARMVKESLVSEFSANLTERKSFFLTTVTRLKASETDMFRQKLFGARARLIMVQRRLGRRAVESLNAAALIDETQGSLGLVLPGEDVLPIAKLIVDFAKEHQEQVAVHGALIDGQLLNKKAVEQLASLPPKPVLLAQVIGTVELPIASVITTVERILGDVIRLADQLATVRASETPGSAPAKTE